MILSFTYVQHVCTDMRCFIETKQNQPTSWNRDIPVMDATQLQACKPKRSTDDQFVQTDQQDTRETCAGVETFSTAFISLPLVMLNMRCAPFHVIFHTIVSRIDEAASTNSLLQPYTTTVHTASATALTQQH